MIETSEATILPFVRPAVEDGTPDDLNWLKRLGVGTIFLCQRKNQGADFFVHAWMVAGITEGKQIYTLVNLQTEKPELVNPIRFCNVFELVEIKRNREEYLVEKALNDERDRTNNIERLDDYESTPSISPENEGS